MSKKRKTKKDNIFYATKIVPYYIDSGKIFFLLGLSDVYKEHSSIGGNCIRDEETIIDCLLREMNEESKKLLKLDLDECFNLNTCKRFDYIIPLSSRKYKEIVIRSTMYFVEYIGPIKKIYNLLALFRNKERDDMLREELKGKDIGVYFEFKDLDFIQVNSHIFKEYLINTFKDQHLRLNMYDKVHEDYMLYQHKSLFDRYKISTLDKKTDNKRFDIDFISGILQGLFEYYGKIYYDVDDIIGDLLLFILDSNNRCQNKF